MKKLDHSRRQKAPSKKDSLESETQIESSGVGERYTVTRRRRGFLQELEIRRIQTARHNGPYRPNGKLALEELASAAREHLDQLGLPTDKWPHMPIELDYSYDPADHGTYEDDELWWDIAVEKLEALSQDRINADLLHAINSVLPHCSEKLLSSVWRLAQVYHRYETMGTLHRAALQGRGSELGRIHGPRSLAVKTRITRSIIWSKAETCWAIYPKLEGEPWNTANKIVDDVNLERKISFPKARDLKPKTISDLLSKMLRENAGSAIDDH